MEDETKVMKKIENSDGHIILACKGHYDVEDVDSILALKRILSCMCGWSHDEHGMVQDKDLSNRLYKIILNVYGDVPHRMEIVQSEIHNSLSNGYFGHDIKPTLIPIFTYIGHLTLLEIKEGGKTLIQLPKSRPDVFKRVVKGEYPYDEVSDIINEKVGVEN